MIPTRAQVESKIRELLGDTEVSGGQIYTNALLDPSIQSAYACLFRVMARHSLPLPIRQSYYNLPAYTSYLLPSSMGISNFGEPASVNPVSERAPHNSASVTAGALTTSPPYLSLTTSAPHSFTAGQRTLVYGLAGFSDEVNDEWTIDVPDVTHVRLMGAQPSGAWTSGGTITDSAETFSALTPYSSLLTLPARTTPAATLGAFAWQGDAFRFPPCSSIRQLRLGYTLSGQAPASGSMGVDDALDFLATYAGAVSSLGRTGGGNSTAALFTMAVGNPAGDDGGADAGYLGSLIRPMVRGLQFNRYQPQRYRPKRNTGPHPAVFW